LGFLDQILEVSRTHLDHPKAVGYLSKRGVPMEQARALGLGYFPEHIWPPKVAGDSEDVQRWQDWSRKGWRLKNKIVFPITNASGMVRGLQVRSPDPDVKDYSKFYLNQSGVDALFFGTHLAMPSIWKTREVYLCEGLFDLPPLMRVFPNALCTGTANVSVKQIEFLRRYVDTVCVVFDTDWGGDRFWREFQEKHGSSFDRIWRLVLPAKDPGELWERLGEEAFRQELTRRGGL